MRVTPGSIAATGLKQGDVVLKIGDLETKYLTHQQAQNQIKTCANLLQLCISKSGGQEHHTHPQSSQYRAADSGQDIYQYRGYTSNDMYNQSPSGYDIGSSTRYMDDPYTSHPQSPGMMHAGNYSNAPDSQFSRMSLTDPNSPYQQTSPTYPYKPTSYNEPTSPYQAHTQQPSYAQPTHQQQSYPFSQQQTPSQPYQSPQSAQPPYQQPSSYNPYLSQSSDTQYGYTGGSQPQHVYSPPVSNNYEPSYSYRPQQAASQQSSTPTYPYTQQAQQTSAAHEHSNYDSGVSSTSSVSSLASNPSPPSPNHPHIPDQILNTMSKTDKKPFSYTPDLNEIKQQRDKVRKRHDIMPKYQQMLNLPNFDDTPPPRKPKPSGPGSAVLSQYNTPIDMYSSNNVADAIIGQTGGLVDDVTPIGQQKSNQKDITESATYKMIHGLEDKRSSHNHPPPQRMPSTEEKGMSDSEKGRCITSPKHGMSFRVLQWLTDTSDAEPTDILSDEEVKGVRSPIREPSKDDELKFSGIHGSSSIPSRSFQVLQRLTSSEPDGGSDKQDSEETVGQYEEASIRYMGRNIPSKSFRMLQQMTGGEQDEEVTTGRRRRKIKEESVEQPSSEEVEDRRYTGADIPSRSFKVLQMAVGSDPVPKPPQAAPKKTPQIDPISSNQHAEHDDGVTDF